MDVNDKRDRREKMPFKDLEVGQAYEDRFGVLCIKTAENELGADINCICFVNSIWESNLEGLDTEVIPLVTTLEIER